MRERWLNLNGTWDYGRDERIRVPYPPESALSGIGRHDDRMRYRRVFEIPPGWAGDRVLLHFGAVDQQASVWVNNQHVATHEGGYTAFSVEVTDVLRETGSQELVVHAQDRMDVETFLVGKQRATPGGIFYTASSGIWQTVWLEPVPATYISGVDITPDLTGFHVRPAIVGPHTGWEIVVSTPDGEVARTTGDCVDIPEPRL